MYSVQVETMAKVQLEIEQLCIDHYREIALHQDSILLDPDWDKYLKLEQVGVLSVVTARFLGTLVGYSIFFISPHLHYKSTSVAINDVVFVSKEHRKSKVGLTLLRAAETECLHRGAYKVQWHIKDHYDFSPILKRWGYAPEEKNWGKVFKEKG